MKRYDIGSYRNRVAFMAPTETTGATGAPQTSWSTETARRWADAVPSSSREYEATKQRYEEVEAIYRVPGFMPVTMRHRLVHDGREFEIVGLETTGNVDPVRARYITVVCKSAR